jgi:putative DNA primase/helicase
LNSEDDWELTLLERFDACGGDRDKLIEVPAHNANGQQFNLYRDLETLERQIDQVGDARLLIIDPVMSFVDGGFNNDEVTSVRELIHRLQKMGRRTKCAIIGLNHLNKNDHVRAKSRINGSAAWEQAPRIVLGAREHPEYGLMLGKIKANIASMMGIYRYEQKHMVLDGKPVVYVDWMEEANDHWQFEKFVSYMGTGTDSGPTNTATQQIAEALQDVLSDGQWHDAKPVIDDLVELYGVSDKTVQRAASTLGVERRRKDKLHGAAEWQLPIT